jgi:subtilase family serine protease
MTEPRRLRSLARAASPSGATLAIAAVLFSCSDSTGPNALAVASGSTPTAPAKVARGALKVDESKLVVVPGNTHPSMFKGIDLGPLPDSTPILDRQLALHRSPERSAAAAAFIARQQDPTSSDYHQWLTPEQVGERFGVDPTDVEAVSGWLQSHGFKINKVFPNRLQISFSGTAGQIRETFHTQLHALVVDGETHYGNVEDPQIPEGLLPVVLGVAQLHDFLPEPMVRNTGPIHRPANSGTWVRDSHPEFSITDGSSTFYALAPTDVGTIYNMSSLWTGSYRGKNQLIAVVGQSDIATASDVTTFWTAMGVTGGSSAPSNGAVTWSTIHPGGCTDPGENSAEGEAALDVEWSGAIARDATIELATCSQGAFYAAEELIALSSGRPNIINVSFGACESTFGATNTATVGTWWDSAVMEGISVFVSSGDQGSAGCDTGSATIATKGLAVNALGSSQYNLAVGGTDFADTYDAGKSGPAVSKYWSAPYTASPFGSALGYIPEIPWNGTCASQLLINYEGSSVAYGASGFCTTSTGQKFLEPTGGGGGVSIDVSQPSWQTGVTGLPTSSGGPRYLPDLSLFAANGLWSHFYVYCMTDATQGGGPCTFTSGADAVALGAGGTSFASPEMAALQAIINQSTGKQWSLPGTQYYALAAADQAAGRACNSDVGAPASAYVPGGSSISSACNFHDITLGDIDQPCSKGSDCYQPVSKTEPGALSMSLRDFDTAFAATTGWDYATGLGTVNAANVVANWP